MIGNHCPVQNGHIDYEIQKMCIHLLNEYGWRKRTPHGSVQDHICM